MSGQHDRKTLRTSDQSRNGFIHFRDSMYRMRSVCETMSLQCNPDSQFAERVVASKLRLYVRKELFSYLQSPPTIKGKSHRYNRSQRVRKEYHLNLLTGYSRPNLGRSVRDTLEHRKHLISYFVISVVLHCKTILPTFSMENCLPLSSHRWEKYHLSTDDRLRL